MALIVCLQCERSYGERKKECPHCGFHNFCFNFCSNRADIEPLVKELSKWSPRNEN